MARDRKRQSRTAAGTLHSPASTTVRDKALSIDEITEKHRGNWVLVNVTEFDELRTPSRGKVVMHSADRGDISKVLEENRNNPGKEKNFYVFFAETLLTSGREFERAISKAVGDLRRAVAGKRAGRNR